LLDGKRGEGESEVDDEYTPVTTEEVAATPEKIWDA